MRAWIINAHAIPPSQGGGTRHYSFAKALNSAGHDLTLIACDTHYAYGKKVATKLGYELIEGVPFYWVPAPVYSGTGLKRVYSHLIFATRILRLQPGAIGDPDVILGSSPHFWQAWAAEILARRLKKPFVLEIRDFWPQSLVDFGGVSERHPMIRWMRKVEPRLYSNSRSIISLLSRAQDYLRGFPIDENKIVWVPNGIDLNLVPKPTPQPNNSPFVITYSGAHGTANGLDRIVNAMSMLKDQPIQMRFIGDGPQRTKLIQQANDLALTNIQFQESVPKKDIFGELAKADAFTTLGVNADVFKWGISPNKVFDYMAMNRPIIYGGRVPDNPIERAGSGLIVDFDATALAEAFISLANAPVEARQAMAESGRQYVEAHHDMAILAKEFLRGLGG